MITKQQARALAEKALERQCRDSDDRVVIVDDETVERAFGWLFFYQSRLFIETGSDRYLLAGNGPVFVSRRDGHVEFLGSYPPWEEIIAEIESREGL